MSKASTQPTIKSTPPAEVVITIDLVRQLIKEQFPDLAHLAIQFLDEGWDNVMFRLGNEYLLSLIHI